MIIILNKYLKKVNAEMIATYRVWVNPGTMYGPETGRGYIRINIACPRSRLIEGLSRIRKVLDSIK